MGKVLRQEICFSDKNNNKRSRFSCLKLGLYVVSSKSITVFFRWILSHCFATFLFSVNKLYRHGGVYAIRNRNSNIFPRISSIKGIGVLINFETKSIVYYYILRLFEGRLLQNMQKVQESI